MTTLDQNISIHTAKDEFLDEAKNFSKPLTPGNITHEFQQQRQRFERLKFTYLEQETRDKFLRIILNDEPHDLKEMENGLEELKNRYLALEDQMNVKQSEIDSAVEQVIKISDSQTERLSELNKLIGEIEEIETGISSYPQYNEVLESVDLSKYEEQYDSQFTPDDNNMDDNDDNEILSYLNHEHNEVVSKELQLNEINQELNQQQALLAKKQQLIGQLESKFAELSKFKEDNSNEFTNLGNWLTKMNSLLSEFTAIKFSSRIDQELIVLTFNKYELELDISTLTVVSTNLNFDEDEYNTTDCKFRRLLQLISDIA